MDEHIIQDPSEGTSVRNEGTPVMENENPIWVEITEMIMNSIPEYLCTADVLKRVEEELASKDITEILTGSFLDDVITMLELNLDQESIDSNNITGLSLLSIIDKLPSVATTNTKRRVKLV